MDPKPLTLRTSDPTPSSDAIVVSLGGRAGVDEASLLAETLRRIAARRPRRVVIDLSGLEFISSIAMGVLIAFRRTMQHPGRVVLAGPQPLVRTLLQHAGVDRLLPIVER